MTLKHKTDNPCQGLCHVAIVLNEIQDTKLLNESDEVIKTNLCSVIDIVRSMNVDFLTLLSSARESEQLLPDRLPNVMKQMQIEKEDWLGDKAIRLHGYAKDEHFKKRRDNRKSHDQETPVSSDSMLQLKLIPHHDGRSAIVSAIRRSLEDVEAGMILASDISADNIDLHITPTGFPDPDLIIFTGGIRTLNNSLLWQCAYAELAFIERPWQEFTDLLFREVMKEFMNRERRFGGLKQPEENTNLQHS